MSRRISFYCDEQVAKAVSKALRRHEVDVQTVPEAGLIGASDKEQLVFAFKEGRVLFTQDDDFLALHKEGAVHAGIVYAPQWVPLGRIVEGLLLIHELMSAEEMAGHVEFL